MTLRDLLDKNSLFSLFHSLLVIILSAPLTLVATHNLMQIFTAAVPPYRCRSNHTQDQAHLPADPCIHYLTPLSNRTEPCREGDWEYDTSVYTATIVSEWDLVCDWESLKELAQSIYMMGVLVGAMVYGALADRFGRRLVLLCCLLQIAVMGTGTALSPSFTLYCIFRFLTGMGMSGLVINDLGLTMEWIPMRYRSAVTMLQGYCLTLGQIILTGISYAITDWRWLQMALSLPFFIFFLLTCWVPESSRWLALTQHSHQALINLHRVARINGEKEGSSITMEMLRLEAQKDTASVTSRPTPFNLFRTPAMCKVTVCLSLVWFSSSFCYFALAMDVERFGVSVYLVQVIFAGSELPLRVLGTVFATYIGRRYTVSFFLILAGLIILGSLAVTADMVILQISLTVLAKGCLGSSIVCSYLYTAELFPTVLRQTGLGFTNMMMRLGAVISPLVMMTRAQMPYLPQVIFGVVPIIFGLPVLWLPETVNCPLLDTVEEVEARARKVKPQNNTLGRDVVYRTKL